MTSLFADDLMLLAESEEKLRVVVNESYTVCKIEKLKVNACKSKVMVFRECEGEAVDVAVPYKIAENIELKCKVRMDDELRDKVR